jgi:hypothetical protein
MTMQSGGSTQGPVRLVVAELQVNVVDITPLPAGNVGLKPDDMLVRLKRYADNMKAIVDHCQKA